MPPARTTGAIRGGELESITRMVGVLQRPLLRRLSQDALFLSGRDYQRKEIVDTYRSDEAYTGAVVLDRKTVVMVYHTDRDAAHQPDIRQAMLDIS